MDMTFCQKRINTKGLTDADPDIYFCLSIQIENTPTRMLLSCVINLRDKCAKECTKSPRAFLDDKSKDLLTSLHCCFNGRQRAQIYLDAEEEEAQDGAGAHEVHPSPRAGGPASNDIKNQRH